MENQTNFVINVQSWIEQRQFFDYALKEIKTHPLKKMIMDAINEHKMEIDVDKQKYKQLGITPEI